MDIHQLITAAVNNYRPNHGDFRVEEWDQKSPINDTPAESILAETPPGHDRVVLLRVVHMRGHCCPSGPGLRGSVLRCQAVARW